MLHKNVVEGVLMITEIKVMTHTSSLAMTFCISNSQIGLT